MFRKKLTPSSLEVRKKLLIAESEINRTLLGRDFQALAIEVRGAVEVVGKASAVLLAAKAATTVVTTLITAFRSKPGADAKPKNSWLSVSWNLLRMGLPLWFGLHHRKNTAHANGQPATEKAQVRV